MGGDRDDRRLLLVAVAFHAANLSRCFQPVHFLHLHIQQDEINVVLGVMQDRFAAIAGEQDIAVEIGHDSPENHEIGSIVVDNHNDRL
ncbi:MAG: hypothetical protein HKP25_07885 [Marinicaulis sp.]|nr:hypothetical protein [Marinicaulis sp.]